MIRTIWAHDNVNRFLCTGSQCEETCCSHWNIEIDKNTYLKYKISDSGLKTVFTNIIKYPILKRTKNAFGRIRLNNSQMCPYLTSDKLCSVQLSYGSEALSLLCYSYPKITNQIDGKLERSLSLACPEAVKLILLNKSLSKLVEYEESSDVPLCINSTHSTTKFRIFNKQKKHYHAIRNYSFSILEDKSFKLWEKLSILGYFYKNIGINIKNTNRSSDSDSILKAFEDATLFNFSEAIDEASKTEVLIMEFLKNIFMTLKNNSYILPTYKECLEESLKGYGFSHVEDSMPTSPQDIYQKYKELHTKYFQEFFKDNEYIFENLISNIFFREMVPFQFYANIFDAYSVFITSYSLIIFHLVGIAGHNQGLTTEMVVKLVYSFSKEFSHNDSLNKIIFMALRLKRMNELKYILGLIKNL